MQGPFSDEEIAAGATPCAGWIATTKPIFKGGQVCMELFSAPPKKAVKAQPVSSLNPAGSALSYLVGVLSGNCTCPERISM